MRYTTYERVGREAYIGRYIPGMGEGRHIGRFIPGYGRKGDIQGGIPGYTHREAYREACWVCNTLRYTLGERHARYVTLCGIP